jgi:hypothetical protein
LPQQGILAKGDLGAETAAAVDAGELANRKREAIEDREGGIMGSLAQQMLPEALFRGAIG